MDGKGIGCGSQSEGTRSTERVSSNLHYYKQIGQQSSRNLTT